MDDRLYIVSYDIADPKRWRQIYKTMCGFGQWLQLSVFQCRLDPGLHNEMVAALDSIIHHKDDHLLIFNLGPVDKIDLQVESLGKTFESVKREPIIV